MSEQIEIPTIECMKKAIWAAIKTKTNFVRSTYLHDGDSKELDGESEYKYTYGPWTDGIMLTENFSNNKNPDIPNTQVVLNKVCINIPEISIVGGEIIGGMTDEFLNEISAKEGLINVNGKFISSDSTKTDAEIKTFDVQVFEAHALGEYLKFLQNNNGRDPRINTIIERLYDVDDGTKIPEEKDIGPDSVLLFGTTLRDIIYGVDGSKTEPERNTVLYDLYGEDGLGANGGIKKDTNNLKNDMYGQNASSVLTPKENSVKWLSQQSIMENGIIMEDTDYIFYKSAIDTLPEYVESNYFTTEKFGEQIRYKLSKGSSTLPDCVGTAIGYKNSTPINMKYEDGKEYYPTLTKITIQYTNTSGVITTEKYEVVNL